MRGIKVRTYDIDTYNAYLRISKIAQKKKHNMKEIDIEERKSIQMSIMDAVHQFCQEHGIRYSLACGSLLGAIRHGGYIPWDDDIDIYMLRKDYTRFAKAFPKVYKGLYEFGALERDEHWTFLFGKVWDNRTKMVDTRQSTAEKGVNIDIFPIDNVPEDDATFERWNKWRKQQLIHLRRSSLHFSQDFALWQNVLVPFVHLRYLFFNRKKAQLRLHAEIQRFNGQNSAMIFEGSSNPFVKSRFPKHLFDDIIDIKFEDRTYKAFAGYDEYLTLLYGDYMTPPPPEKQVPHHFERSYWK